MIRVISVISPPVTLANYGVRAGGWGKMGFAGRGSFWDRDGG